MAVSPRRSLRVCLALAALVTALHVGAQVPAPAASGAAAPFRLGMDSELETLSGRWIRKIYEEAFRRLNVPLELQVTPSQRLSVLTDEGTLDGDVLRVYGYAHAHPNQVRVEESVFDVVFSLYTADPALQLARLEDLAGKPLLGEFRRGVAICERTLRQWLPDAQVSDVAQVDQALRKLRAQRTDIFCDNNISVATTLVRPEFAGAPALRRLLDIDKPLPLYPYLHRKHAALAPRLAATIAKMKAEGLIQRYWLEAQRDVGAPGRAP